MLIITSHTYESLTNYNLKNKTYGKKIFIKASKL